MTLKQLQIYTLPMRCSKRKARIAFGRSGLGLAVAAAVLAFGAPACADADFSRWLQLLWVDAQKQGVSSATFDEALRGVQLDLSLLTSPLPAGDRRSRLNS